MGPLISGKSRLVKYYSIWPDLWDDVHLFFVKGDVSNDVSIVYRGLYTQSTKIPVEG